MVLTVAASNGTVTIGDIYIGDTKLTKTTHYTENDGEITIKKEKLDDLEAGDHVIKVETDQGVVTAVITVTDTTALTADPATAVFDKNPSGDDYDDVVIEISHNTTSVSLMAVYIGEDALTQETHYTTADLAVTILKTYLATLDKGAVTITFKTDKGDVDAVITIEDTTEVG